MNMNMFTRLWRSRPFTGGVDIVVSEFKGEIVAVGLRYGIKAGQEICVDKRRFGVLEIDYCTDPDDVFYAALEERS